MVDTLLYKCLYERERKREERFLPYILLLSISHGSSTKLVCRLIDTHNKHTAPAGQILLKHELVALAKLLASYSDEKLKSIKLNLQKKQGGDISREEVERTLRESGLTSIADDLKDNLKKSMLVYIASFNFLVFIKSKKMIAVVSYPKLLLNN